MGMKIRLVAVHAVSPVVAAACGGTIPPPDSAARTAADSAAALARAANAFADSPGMRRAGRMASLLPRFPKWLANRVIRGMRENTPGKAVRQRARVVDTSYAGVPVSWINRDRRANGVIIYIHGGAYVLGPTADEWNWLTTLAERTNTAAVGIVYRMPTDHPFPAALDDAVAAVKALVQSGALPRDRWILLGGSAGGGLATATMRSLLDQGVSPRGLLLLAPWVDLLMQDSATVAQDERDPFLSRNMLGWAARLYAGRTPIADPRISPINASFTGFPPTYIDVGTRDLFLPQDRLLRDRMRAAGVGVTYVEQDGGVHVYAQARGRPEAAVSIAAQAAWIAAQLRTAEE